MNFEFFSQLRIRYTRAILEEMISCARLAHPNEGCALIFGRKFEEKTPDKSISNIIYSAQKVDCIPSSQLTWGSFFISEEVLLEKSKTAEAEGLKLVSIFHSHPAPAEPSSIDAQYMRSIDGYRPLYAVWIIHSTLLRKKTRAYFFIKGQIYEVEQQIVP